MMTKPLNFPPIFKRIQPLLSSGGVYLVGGAIRDALLGLETRDLDFALPHQSVSTARKVADKMDGAFYILDDERGVARVILFENDQRYKLDFTAFEGREIEEDLRARDFTVTAMAVPVENPRQLIDPLGGLSDLQKKVLRACTPHAMKDDPLRILRAVRLAVGYDFRIEPDTKSYMVGAKEGLRKVSPERVRDEFFRMLEGPRRSSAVKTLSMMDLLPFLLGEDGSFTRYHQRSLRYLEELWELLGEEHDPEAAASWAMGLSVLRLGRYRDQIHAYLGTALVPERTLPALISFAALFLPGQPGNDAQQKTRRSAKTNGRSLRLSNEELERVDRMLQAVQALRGYTAREQSPGPREVYRYFQNYAEGGVDGIFLALADVLARHGPSAPLDLWPRTLDVARVLLEAWWEKGEQMISPPALVDGHELMAKFDLSPGPMIGKVLMALREEQAVGNISSKEEAISFAAGLLKKNAGEDT